MLRPYMPQSRHYRCPTLPGIVEIYQLTCSSHGVLFFYVPLKNAFTFSKPVASFGVSIDSDSGNCIICKERHLLCVCSNFRGMVHDEKRATLKSLNLCMNCLRSGYFVESCKSLHKCHVCQNPHHNLLHVKKSNQPVTDTSLDTSIQHLPVSSNIAMKIQANTLLMSHALLKCRPHMDLFVTTRALIDLRHHLLLINWCKHCVYLVLNRMLTFLGSQASARYLQSNQLLTLPSLLFTLLEK